MSACYTCVCHEAYKNRGMIDPGCQAHDECPQYERLMARIAALEAILYKIEGSSRPRNEPAWQYDEIRALLGMPTTVKTKAKPVKEDHCPKCGEELGPDGHHLPDPVEPFI